MCCKRMLVGRLWKGSLGFLYLRDLGFYQRGVPLILPKS